MNNEQPTEMTREEAIESWKRRVNKETHSAEDGEKRADTSRHITARIFLGILASVAAIQSIYLVIVMLMSAPTPSSELVYVRYPNIATIFLLVALIIATAILGWLAIELPEGWYKLWYRTTHYENTPFLYGLAILLIISIVGNFNTTTYEIYFDSPAENIVRRELHLLPCGVQDQTIPFSTITGIVGEFVEIYDRGEYDYVLYIETEEYGVLEVWRSRTMSSNDAVPPEAASMVLAMAEAMDRYAPIDLR